ncbi:hypothetical protein FIBSPDRAFT_849741 [Athelia psychrophila]|uniref:K Homology domain-containing protein n=1 Tax=Athelia psychrophila TaxID=1759441 RepID=A0A166U2S7_9AGAM|nr:hypothetical protein FIBSPDRAFT_849741 [Fibularhizoctonia sp. CBS 109695]
MLPFLQCPWKWVLRSQPRSLKLWSNNEEEQMQPEAATIQATQRPMPAPNIKLANKPHPLQPKKALHNPLASRPTLLEPGRLIQDPSIVLPPPHSRYPFTSSFLPPTPPLATESSPTRSGFPGAQSRSPSPSPQDTLTLRALVSTKDADTIIDKGDKIAAYLSEQTDIEAGVSEVIQGVDERVLTVTGLVEAVAKAYTLIITQLVSSAPSSHVTASASPAQTSIRLLISHNLMGAIIGRSGIKIKAIQDDSGARMVASKDMLPQSTERIVEVHGTPESIGRAIEEIGKCLLEDWERGVGTVLFHPAVEARAPGVKNRRREDKAPPAHDWERYSGSGRRPKGDSGRLKNPRSKRQNGGGGAHISTSPSSSLPLDGAVAVSAAAQPTNLRTQNISIPSDMVGCVIGRSGTKITEIRRLSGSKISIAKAPHDDSGERMFTIVGTTEANEKALFLLYNQLESEKERRVGREQESEQQE